eukprot:CAMPEP_0181172748 /NCGR_PEP_ID=MMETSP1096-20121128/2615_1 /TAXON_ID=156174 ORGANISM="Chrysochromulina ericina, Strain CCMP281" /NCGR_SAMPLE_ID=MMETSP1096 /ASSEMBLY_ACC=CAM_ASM_000453 /LENGTH=145 /DNA_ID=CAMNT_0023260497 /DNA_START=371 /DNA_END=808 /DNA_ORIENTATION=-
MEFGGRRETLRWESVALSPMPFILDWPEYAQSTGICETRRMDGGSTPATPYVKARRGWESSSLCLCSSEGRFRTRASDDVGVYTSSVNRTVWIAERVLDVVHKHTFDSRWDRNVLVTHINGAAVLYICDLFGLLWVCIQHTDFVE